MDLCEHILDRIKKTESEMVVIVLLKKLKEHILEKCNTKPFRSKD